MRLLSFSWSVAVSFAATCFVAAAGSLPAAGVVEEATASQSGPNGFVFSGVILIVVGFLLRRRLAG